MVTNDVTSPGSSDVAETTYAYTFYTAGAGESPWMVKKVVRSEPVVTTAENGSNAATTTEAYYDEDHQRLVFARDRRGIYTYYEYDALEGHLTKNIEDVGEGSGTSTTAGATSSSSSRTSTQPSGIPSVPTSGTASM